MSATWQQITILTVEALFVGCVILLLFRLRSRLGLLPLAAFVGSNQYVQTILASTHYIRFSDEVLVSPGSAVLFPAALLAVLLIYQQDGVPQARSLIYGILLSNLTLTVLSYFTSLQIQAGQVTNLLAVPEAIFQVNPRVFLAGTAILALDCLAVVIVYELLFARRRSLPSILRLPSVFLIVLSFDSVAFSTLAFAGHPAFSAILSSQLASKTLAGALYGLMFFGYLHRVDPQEETHSHGTGSNMWAILTYRERYEILRQQKKAQEQAFEEERTATQAALDVAELRYRTLFDTMNDGLMVVDVASGRIIELNPALAGMSGRSHDALVGLKLSEAELFEAQTVAGVEPAMSAEWETQLLRRDGSPLDVELQITRFARGGSQTLALMVHDVTARKAAERARRRREIERLKDRFISTVSHELRTPLTSIYGSLKLVTDGKMGALEERIARYLKVALRNARRLRWLINDILDFQRIESGLMQLDLESYDLPVLVEQAIEDNQAFADRYGVDLTYVSSGAVGHVVTDRQWLLQVLTNLISNAVKHSPEGATVSLAVDQRTDSVRISVVDQGSGIPEGFREQLFQPFSQAQLGNKPKEGSTGLGLSIAKRLVEKMHGTLDFETEVGQGTTFHVDLPTFLPTEDDPMATRPGVPG